MFDLLVIGLILLVVGGGALAVSLSAPKIAVRDRLGAPDKPRRRAPWAVTDQVIGLDQIPALIRALSTGTAKARWATLIFQAPDRPDTDDALNLNLTVQNGGVGFDWVLLGPSNLVDREAFEAFARARGSEPVFYKAENGVTYLRVERADLAAFTASIVTEMYALRASEPLVLLHDGFDWPPR